MEEKEVEKLVEREVLKVKVITQEKTIRFLLWFFGVLLTVFGVLIPLWWSNRSSDKVDEAISETKKEMKEVQAQYEQKNIDNEKNFKETVREINSQQNSALTTISNNAEKTLKETKEQAQSLIGQQLAKPIIKCLYKGEDINGKIITLSSPNWWSLNLELLNNGDAPTRNVKVVMYFKKESKIKAFSNGLHWMELGVGEEKEFTQSYGYQSNDLNIIDAKYSTPITLDLQFDEEIKYAKDEVLLKVFFGQPEPARFAFFLEVKK